LSPRENRSVPPLHYDVVYRLKADFPQAAFVLNGGLATLEAVRSEIGKVDGVMLGRAAYHDPYLLAALEREIFTSAEPTRARILERMSGYLQRCIASGTAPRHVVRHMLGLYQGVGGARQWRRLLSDAAVLEREGANALRFAAAAVDGASMARAA
jgi:tRNA-dihydrouridine synthase A